ncbi:MAG: glycosyltransferase family 8 protein, partial [Acutalibacteraceae bacterium]
MNILVTIDKNYLPPLKVMLVSMGESNKDVDVIDVYIAHSNLTEEDIRPLVEATDCFKNIHIHSLKVPDRFFADTPVIERLPKESFYRLIAFAILPETVERCIYIDPDTYILRSLKPLYDTDMGDCFIGAGSHTYSYIEKLNHVRLKMGKDSKYINSGIMLMDLKKMREHTSVEEIMQYLDENIQKLFLGDQD